MRTSTEHEFQVEICEADSNRARIIHVFWGQRRFYDFGVPGDMIPVAQLRNQSCGFIGPLRVHDFGAKR